MAFGRVAILGIVCAFLFATLPETSDAKSRRPRVARKVVTAHKTRVVRSRVGRMRIARTRLPPPQILPATPRIPTAPPTSPYESAMLVDADSQTVLFASSPDREWAQASLVKMMVGLLAFEAIRDGEVSADSLVVVSPYAARMNGSQVFLHAGEVQPLADLIRAMWVASANDAAAAVAEAVGGSAEAMIARMNHRAQELGMTGTRYYTVNGLPPNYTGTLADVTTAHDLAILARKLLEMPQVVEITSLRETDIRGGRMHLRSTNHLLGRTLGVDGLKTGYCGLSGFNFVATGKRDGMRLVAIVLGSPSQQWRFRLGEEFLEWGFANYSRLELVRAGDTLSIDIHVEDGKEKMLRPVAGETTSLLIRNGEEKELEVRFQVPRSVAAPVARNQALGEVIVRDGDDVLAVIPAVSPEEIAGVVASSQAPIAH